MPIAKPIKLEAGEFEEFGPDDMVQDSNIHFVSNNAVAAGGSNDIVPGACVYITGFNINSGPFVALAKADSAVTAKVTMLATETIPESLGQGFAQSAGAVKLTTTQWDNVTGEATSGLVPGTKYYLSPAIKGRITSTPPSGSGEIRVPVGTALTPEIMIVRIEPAVLVA